MTWVILTGRQSDLDQVATPHKIITNRDYLAHPALFRGQRPKVINLSNNYGYQSRGYYSSLLASSRGHKVIPTVETMIDLSERKLYEHALPELELALNKCRKDLGGAFPAKVDIFFGIGPSKVWDRFAKLLFDWFRAPALEVHIKDSAEWASIRKIGFLPLARMTDDEEAFFLQCLETYTNREWRDTKGRTPARYTFATLVDPHEELPPSEISSLRYWAKIAEKMGVEVEPITKKDLAKLANYDALFIRETTSISNHTYRFARRAQQEGMPVIDEGGVVGQIVRVTPFTSEAALLIDDQVSIPVQVLRNGLRLIAFGGNEVGKLEVRYLSAGVDVRAGDVLVTSGIGGLFPAGLSVGRVEKVDRDPGTGFAMAIAEPLSHPERYRHFLVLRVDVADVPRPEEIEHALDEQ